MKTINISLMTKDLEYGIALARSLQLHSKLFSIQMDIDRQETNSQSLENREFDILVTDDMNSSAKRIVLLTEEPALAQVDPQSRRFIIYKYQHAGNISSILRLAHSVFSKTEMLSDETEKANIISICASSGGSGCTAIALGICQELIRFHGKKALYISLEEFESTASYFPAYNPETINISRYLYSIINDQNAASWTTDGYLMQDEFGVCTFHPAKGRNPLRELEGCEFVKFINHVTRDMPYTDLVLDCGTGLDASIVSAFELSSKVFHISGKNQDANRKDSYLRTVAHRAGRAGSFDMTEILNFYDDPESDNKDVNEKTAKELLTIEEDPLSFTEINGHRFLSLDKTFGLGIRQIVDWLACPDG